MAITTDSIELSDISQHPPEPSPLPSLTPSKANSFISNSSSRPLTNTAVGTDGQDGDLNGQSNGREQVSLPPVDRGKKAWTFVASAAVLETFIWGYGICYSVILLHLQSSQHWQQKGLASLASVGTVQLGLMYFLTFFVNAWFKRYSNHAKTALYAAAVIYPLSLLLSSFATEVWQLILTQGVLCGLSGAVLYAPCLLWTMDWFVERRGLASGIIFSGTGLGGAGFPFVLGALLERYGFSWTCRIWALICFVAFGAATFFIRPRVPPPKFAKGQPRPKWFMVSLKSLNHPVNYVVGLTTLIASISYFPVSLYLPLYTESVLGSSANALLPNTVAATFNFVGFLASMAIGYASDKSLAATATVIGIVGGAVALGAWQNSDTLLKVFIFSAIFGATTPISSYWASATRQIGDPDPYVSGAFMCIWGMIRGVASIFSPFLSSALYHGHKSHSKSDSYGFKEMIVFVGVLSIVSSAGGIALGFLKWQSTAAEKRSAAVA